MGVPYVHSIPSIFAHSVLIFTGVMTCVYTAPESHNSSIRCCIFNLLWCQWLRLKRSTPYQCWGCQVLSLMYEKSSCSRKNNRRSHRFYWHPMGCEQLTDDMQNLQLSCKQLRANISSCHLSFRPVGRWLSHISIYAIYGFRASYFRSRDILPWSSAELYHGSSAMPIWFSIHKYTPNPRIKRLSESTFNLAAPKFDSSRPKFDPSQPKFDSSQPKFNSSQWILLPHQHQAPQLLSR